MAKPTNKSKIVEGVLDLLLGGKPGDNIRGGAIRGEVCIDPPMGCGKEAKVFKDERSKREYRITGFCQHCQDTMLGV